MKIYDFLLFLCYCMNKQLAKQQLWPSRGVVEGELAPAPVGYDALTRCVTQETCSALEDHSSRHVAIWWGMYREDLLVTFFLLFVFIHFGRGVMVEERAVMAVCVESNWLAWDFDATRGFPGEDIRNLLS